MSHSMKKLQYTVSGDSVSVISFKLTENECPHVVSYFIKSETSQE